MLGVSTATQLTTDQSWRCWECLQWLNWPLTRVRDAGSVYSGVTNDAHPLAGHSSLHGLAEEVLHGWLLRGVSVGADDAEVDGLQEGNQALYANVKFVVSQRLQKDTWASFIP